MTEKKTRAIAALVTNATKERAARSCGISASTLRRWLRDDPEFQSAYKDAVDGMLEDAAAQAKQYMVWALSTLISVMRDGENSQVRVSAARSLLEYGLRLHDAADVVSRMGKLEQMLEEAERR